MISSPEQQAVDAAITSRRSIRAFLPTPVLREDIEAILEVAARAPSGIDRPLGQAHNGAAITAAGPARVPRKT